MHETCWGGGAAVSCATEGVSLEGLGKHRWLLSCVRVCGPYRMTAGIIDEQLVLLRAYARIVLMPSNGLAGPVRLPACKRGLCWQPATNFAQHTALLCAQARVALFGVGGRDRCLSCYTHIARPASTPSASPHATSRG